MTFTAAEVNAALKIPVRIYKGVSHQEFFRLFSDSKAAPGQLSARLIDPVVSDAAFEPASELHKALFKRNGRLVPEDPFRKFNVSETVPYIPYPVLPGYLTAYIHPEYLSKQLGYLHNRA